MYMNINKNVCKTIYPIESVGFHSRISEDDFFLQPTNCAKL